MKNLFFILILFSLAACQSPTPENEKSTTAKTVQPAPVKTVSQMTPVKAEDGIKWVSLEKAQELVKKEPRKIIMDVYTHWCGPCKMLDRMTFADARVIEHINTNYYAVKFNAESPDPVTFKGKEYSNPQYIPNRRGRNAPHQLTMAMGVRGYPTMMVFDSGLNVLKNIVGFHKPDQLLQELSAL